MFRPGDIILCKKGKKPWSIFEIIHVSKNSYRVKYLVLFEKSYGDPNVQIGYEEDIYESIPAVQNTSISLEYDADTVDKFVGVSWTKLNNKSSLASNLY